MTREKGEHGVKTESADALLVKIRNIINHGAMLPGGRSKNYSHSYEFHQIICPFNKHRRNKHSLGKTFKFNFLKLIPTTTIFLVIVMLNLTEFHGIKGNNSFRLQKFFDKHMVFGCKSIER